MNNKLWRMYKLHCYKNGLAEGNYKVFREFMLKNCTDK